MLVHYVPHTKGRYTHFTAFPTGSVHACLTWIALLGCLPSEVYLAVTDPAFRDAAQAVFPLTIPLPFYVVLHLLSHHLPQPWYPICWCPLPDHTVTYILVLFFLLGVHFLKFGSINDSSFHSALHIAPTQKAGLCFSYRKSFLCLVGEIGSLWRSGIVWWSLVQPSRMAYKLH